MNNNYALWGGVTVMVIVIVLGLMWLVGNTPTPAPGTTIEMPPVTAEDWQKGDAAAPLTLVEYSDFQCPACKAFYPVLKQISMEYATSTRVIYRHFPLQQHLDAKMAAYAAEAAGKQGKFFEMHDMLFEKQDEWAKDSRLLPTDPTTLSAAQKATLETKLVSYATVLGLDMTKFKADMESKEIADKVEAALTDAQRIGIPATPTFFLNGKQLQNPAGYEGFKALLDAELKTQ